MLESSTAVARICFFVLYSVLKVRSPARKQAAVAVSLVRLLLPCSVSLLCSVSERAVTLGLSLGAVNLAVELLRCVLGATRENLPRFEPAVQIEVASLR